jgi:hypothetical protein
MTTALLLMGWVSVSVIAADPWSATDPVMCGVAEKVITDCWPTPRLPMSQWTLFERTLAVQAPL